MTLNPGNEEAIFLAALERRTPEERAQFVDHACSGDAALRERVLTLLKAHDASRGPFDASAPELQGTLIEPDIACAVGDQIGPYKLLQQIGEGGMGTVYMAEQTQPVKRRVALKLIKAGMDSRQVIARFEAERQALAMMDHVNIARVLDAGTTGGEGRIRGETPPLSKGGAGGVARQGDDVSPENTHPAANAAGSPGLHPLTPDPRPLIPATGRPYFVMELVHGLPITKYCDENHLSPRERLELFVPVCHAIQHAHQKGIIHRDIKPSNVMVTLYDGKPVPKVIDFGVAKATEQPLTERTLFTQYGTMVGTLEYMSPEQAEMSALGVDTRSDIYSLGVLLYELLTGSTPLSQKQLREAGYGEILRMIKEVEPPRPSTRLSDSGEALASISAQRHMEPAKLTKLVQGELDWIVMKTLEKDRNRRYETSNGLAADLLRYLNDEPVLACPPSSAYRLRKFARKNKRLLATMTVLGALLVVATIGAGLAAVQSRRLAEKEQELRSAAEERADAEIKARIELDQRLYANRIALAQQELYAQNTGRAQELLEECPPAQRGWEWKFLKRFRPGNPLSLHGEHRGAVFSPDGRFLAVSGGALVHIVEPSTGRQIRTFHGLKTFPDYYGLAFHQQGGETILAAGDARATVVKLWDVETGREIQTLGGHGQRLRSVVFSPDGRQLAAGCISLGAKVWDWKNARVLYELPDISVSRLAYSPDGERLAVSAFDTESNVGIYAAASGTLLRKYMVTHGSGIEGLSYSPDSRRLATSGNDGTIQVVDETTGELLHALRGHVGSVKDVTYSPNGKRLASAGWDKTVKLWDAENGQELLTLRGHTEIVMKLAFSPNGELLTTSGGDSAKIWDASQVTELVDKGVLDVRGHTGFVTNVAFSPDGLHLASAGADRMIRVWDVATLRRGTQPQCAVLQGNTGVDTTVTFRSDSRRLASAGWGGKLKIWDTRTLEPRLAQPLHTRISGNDIRGIAYSPDGERLAGVGPGGVSFRDAITGEVLVLLPIPSGNLHGLAYSPDGRDVAVCHHTSLMLVDTASGKELRSLPHGTSVAGVAYSPDGKRLATACYDHSLRLWDTENWKEIRTLRGHTDRAVSVAFSPDGSRLASGGGDSTVRFWNADDGQELATLRGHTGYVWSVAFSPDGERLASAGGHHRTGEVRLWDLPALFPEAGQPEAVENARQAIDFYQLLAAAQPKVWEHRRNLGHAFAKLGQSEHAAIEYRRAVKLNPAALSELVGVLTEHGQPDEIESIDRELNSISGESPRDAAAHRANRELLARHYRKLGETHSAGGRADEALQALFRAAELFAELVADYPDVIWYRENLGHTLRVAAFATSNTDESQKKERALREAVEVFRSLAADFPMVLSHRHYQADTARQIGHLLFANNRPGDASDAYSESVELRKKMAIDAPEDANNKLELANCHNELGTAFKTAGRRDEAERHYRQALALKESLVAGDTANPGYRFHLAHTHLGLGYLKLEAGEPGEAGNAFRQAQGLFEKLSDEFPARHEYRSNLGHSLWHGSDASARGGKHDEAEAALRKALGIFVQLTRDAPDVTFYRFEHGFSHWRLGWLFASVGRHAEAETQFREGVPVYRALAADYPQNEEFRQRHNRSYHLLMESLLAQWKNAEAEEVRQTLYREFPEEQKPSKPEDKSTINGN